MSALVKRRQLVLAGLVLALGAAMFVNWYYTKPTTDIGQKISTETTSGNENINLGDAQYVNGTAMAQENGFFAEAQLKRANAHDEAKSALTGIIENAQADEAGKAQASEQLNKLTENMQLEADIENLISAKTSGKCLVTVGDTVEVIAQSGTVTEENITKMKEIIINKTKVTGDKITIIEAK